MTTINNISQSESTDHNTIYDLQIGDYIKEMWLEPLNISQYRLAKSTGIKQSQLSRVLTFLARIPSYSPRAWG